MVQEVCDYILGPVVSVWIGEPQGVFEMRQEGSHTYCRPVHSPMADLRNWSCNG